MPISYRSDQTTSVTDCRVASAQNNGASNAGGGGSGVFATQTSASRTTKATLRAANAVRASRRGFLRQSLATAVALPFSSLVIGRASARAENDRPLKVAAILTEFTYRSHAHVILENFLVPYLFNGQRTEPGMQVVSFYVDQFPKGRDMARDVSRQFGIPIFPTIGEALTLGGDRLAVDAVLSIGEHGQYPYNEKGQHMYPRKRFFDEIVAVFRDSNRTAPVYNDKHLSYRWDWARQMYDTAKAMGFGLMAGSSVPLAQRRPPMEIARGTPLKTAVSIHGGGVESYDFHGMEVLQSVVEFRRGAETGIRRVQFLDTEALWQAADEGRWSVPLAEAAMAAELGNAQKLPPLKELIDDPRVNPAPPHGILLTYRDGFEAIVLKIGNSGIRWNFAASVAGETKPRATHFYVGPWQNRNLFRALSHAIQHFFRTGKSPYPVERTLLVTGALAAAMDSRFEGGKPVDTPHLDIAYEPLDFRAMREMGATWRIITDQTPQPKGIEPVGVDDG